MQDIATLLAEVAQEHGVPAVLLRDLIRLERTVRRRGRQGINTRLREAIKRSLGAPVPGELPDDLGPLAPHSLVLEAIRFTNFRVFGDGVTFEPRTTPERRVCLVEGPNGFGKSTIIYGLLWLLGDEHGLAEVDDGFRFPVRLLHQGTGRRPREMAVEAVFQSSLYGRVVIRRSVSFHTETGAIDVARHTVKLADSELQDRDAEEWISQHLPKEVVSYFIFDAERSRLNELAGQLGESLPDVREMVEDVLGVRSIRKLAKRVREQAVGRWRKEADAADPTEAEQDILAELKRIQAAIRSRRERLARLHKELPQLRDDEQRLAAEVKRLKDQLDGYGGHGRPGELEERRRRLREEVGKLRGQLAEQVRRRLVLAPLLAPLREEAARHPPEQAPREWVQGARFAARRIADLVAARRVDWLAAEVPDAATVAAELEAALGLAGLEAPGPARPPVARWLHAAEEARDRIDPGLASRLRAKQDELERLEREINTLRVPPAELVERYQRARAELEEVRKGVADREAEELRLQAEIQGFEDQVNELMGRLRELGRKKGEHQKLLALAERAEAVVRALEALAPRVVASRLDVVERTASELLARVTNKPDERHAIRFDRDTLRFQIVDREGRPAPPDHSTGERTVVALALVWALQQASALRLPTVLEAPLRPLDGVHSGHTLRELFAAPPHQAVILEVPDRVDADALRVLRPNLASRWRLDRQGDEVRLRPAALPQPE